MTTLFQKKISDTIILETTGVANPFNLLSGIDELGDLIDYDSIVTIVDANSYKKLVSSYIVFKDQLRSADVILLNKIDLLSKEEIEEVEEQLHIQNRCSSIIKTVNCSINPLVITNSVQENNSLNQISNQFQEAITHFRTHHDDNLSSMKKTVDKKLNRKEFEQYLKNVSKNILRVNGIVEYENSDSQFLIQYVNSFYEINELYQNKEEKIY